MKKVIIHEDAEKELWYSVDYYEDKVAGLGLDFEYEIQKALLSIQRHPGTYTESKYGARRLLLHRFPYFIYYNEYAEYIWIIAFAHTSREPYYWKTRIS